MPTHGGRKKKRELGDKSCNHFCADADLIENGNQTTLSLGHFDYTLTDVVKLLILHVERLSELSLSARRCGIVGNRFAHSKESAHFASKENEALND